MPEQDQTAELMKQLGKEVLHDVQPSGLKLLAEILRNLANHLDNAATTHPDAPKVTS